ncbi:MAG: response regulator transcription factor [Treponema sp.]|jgi:two-component system phosphate regulon response regulator PhoB|nr:response regulator transcription factor [Treponema sp.]
MIYVVEDNDAIRELIVTYLELEGYKIHSFNKVQGVLDAFAFKQPDLIILDVMLPDGNGFSLAKTIVQKYPETPFLFLTARESESDRITGLELGADDYIVKPFSPRELVLRVNTILRRSKHTSLNKSSYSTKKEWHLENHCLCIDEKSHEVIVDNREVKLTAVEWEILLYLSNNEGIVMSREKILGECLDYYHDGSDKTVNTHIKNLRAKLGDAPWIETVRGFGYKFSISSEKSES